MKLAKASAALLVLAAVFFSFYGFTDAGKATAPSVPVIVSPSGGATTDRTPQMVWQKSTSSNEPRFYDFQITESSDPNFNSPVLTKLNLQEGGGIGNETYILSGSGSEFLQANTEFLWRLRCHTDADGYSAYSSGALFQTNSNP